MKAENANGRTACLIYAGDGKYKIRIYHENKLSMFKDYDIKLLDLMFKIVDEDAYLYEDSEKLWLDYSPETLGIELP